MPVLWETQAHTQLFSKDELEKSMAWRHGMSLNVWVKQMDCFSLLWLWPLLLPHQSHIQSKCNPPFSLILHSRFTLFSLVFLVITSPSFPHPHPSSCFCASGHSSSRQDQSDSKADVHNTHKCMWRIGLNDISLSYLYLDMNIQDINIEKETI